MSIHLHHLQQYQKFIFCVNKQKSNDYNNTRGKYKILITFY